MDDLTSHGRDYILTIACTDRPGIVHAVTSFLVEHSSNIRQSQQFDEPANGRRPARFFMRVHFEVLDADIDLDTLNRGFSWVAEAFGVSWRLVPAGERTRTLIMVSKYGHCLNDLLFRWHLGALPIDVVGVVSNHPDFESLVSGYGVGFHHVPVTKDTKPQAEAELMRLVEELDVDLVVLARYMQILSDDLCKYLDGRAINIHHSFLPSFKGARPYQQAYDRGVKLIGATAHYVTGDLDEGPIIEQDVARVDHRMDADALAGVGRDVEARVLARAVQWHTEHRVLRSDGRTVVFQ